MQREGSQENQAMNGEQGYSLAAEGGGKALEPKLKAQARISQVAPADLEPSLDNCLGISAISDLFVSDRQSVLEKMRAQQAAKTSN